MLAVEWPIVRATFSEQDTGSKSEAKSEAIHRLEQTKACVPEIRQRIGPARWNALENAYGGGAA